MSVTLKYKTGTDGMLYPNIVREKENLSQLGKYGLMAMDYLKENHHGRYLSLVRFGRLTEVLAPVNEEAHRMEDHLMEQYLKTHPAKNPADTMEMWRIREQGLRQAEEIIRHDLINQYH
jgi:hypothetical protein